MKLVKQGLRSKEIARELGISPRTVDQHIAAAMETLGVHNRLAAVSRLRELERGEPPPNPEPGPPAKPPTLFILYDTAPAPVLSLESDPSSYVHDYVEDAQATTRKDAHRPSPLPPIGGTPNAAPNKVRLGWIARIAIFSVMFSCALILSILGVIELAGKAT